MAERKATNKYYPPEWDPSKGSINTFVGQHPLRERARKLDQGILIIRFELPYSVWCLGCNGHVGMGVRFNAEKKRVGNYYSTPIFSFRMKCHLCSHWWEIKTDPKNAAYVVVSGAKQKIETWDPEENGTLKLLDDKERETINNNALSKLEHKISDKKRGDEAITILNQLTEESDRKWGDVYSNSKLMRKKLREEKKVLKAKAEKENKFIKSNSLYIKLLPESESDELRAKTITFASNKDPSSELKKQLVKPLFQNKKSSEKFNDKTIIEDLKIKASVNTLLKEDPFISKKETHQKNDMKLGIMPKVVSKKDSDVTKSTNTMSTKKPNLLVDYNYSDSEND